MRRWVRWGEVRQEPFRVLFPLGILFGCLGVGHWLVFVLGWWPSASGHYHASIQIDAYLYCFIAGFLLTALPRFTATAPATQGELVTLLGLLAALVAMVSLGWWAAGVLVQLGLVGGLAGFALRRLAGRRTPVTPPTEMVWVPIGLACGLAGGGLLFWTHLLEGAGWAAEVGEELADQGFVLGMVLGVGGFLVPRLLGRDAVPIAAPGMSATEVRRLRQRRLALHGGAALLFVLSFALEGAEALRPAYLLRAAVVTAELAWTTQFYRRPRVRTAYAGLLWLSLWMVSGGLWGAGLFPRYEVAMLHVMFLGGFSLMTFVIGTIVVLSHTGAAHDLQRPLWVLRIVGSGILLATGMRVAADFWPAGTWHALGTASGCWLVAALTWLGVMLPRVVHGTEPASCDRTHEQLRRTVLQAAIPPRCHGDAAGP